MLKHSQNEKSMYLITACKYKLKHAFIKATRFIFVQLAFHLHIYGNTHF